MTQTTNKDLALIILKRLIDLETQQTAMRGILDNCKNVDTRELLDWRPMVRRESSTLREMIHARYADIERKVLASKSDCPDALSLLESVSKDLVSGP